MRTMGHDARIGIAFAGWLMGMASPVEAKQPKLAPSVDHLWKAIGNPARARLAVAAIPGKDAQMRPLPCHLKVAERPAPDFDGDGKDDTLFRLQWLVPESEGDSPPRCPRSEGSAGNADRYILVILARSRTPRIGHVVRFIAGDTGQSFAIDFGRSAAGTPVILLKETSAIGDDRTCLEKRFRVIDGSATPIRDISETSERKGCPN